MAAAAKADRGAIERFWRLVIASALNADLDSIALPYAAKVIRELFMNSAQAGSMGMSTVPLSELYAGAAEFLRRSGSSVLFNTSVESAAWDEKTSQWSLATRNGVLESEFLVLALPFEATAKLLPQMPQAEGADALAAQLERHQHWPICSVHLWFDREITTLDHAVLLDREIHWLYNKSRLQPWRKGKGSYVELVVSASRAFAALSREQAIDLGGARTEGVFSGGGRSEVGKSRAGEGGARDLRRAAGDRCGSAGVRFAVAELLSGRGLDGDRLAFDDGERGAVGASGGGGGLREHGGAASHSRSRFEAAGNHEIYPVIAEGMPT